MGGIQVEIVPRSCAFCGKGFRVLATSTQRYCGTFCAKLAEERGDRCLDPTRLKGNALTSETVIVNGSRRTQSTAFDSERSGTRARRKGKKRGNVLSSLSEPEPDGEPSITQTLSDSVSEIESDMNFERKNEMQSELSGVEKTERDSSSDSVPGTRPTAIVSVPLSTMAENVETRPTDLVAPSENLRQAVWDSMNLLSSTQKHLHGLMLGLHLKDSSKDKIDQFVQALDPDRVRAAAECGKQLISTARMQLDMMKFAKELKDSEK